MAEPEKGLLGHREALYELRAPSARGWVTGRGLRVLGWLIVAVALPAALHPAGLGPMLLPMHLPVLLAGASLGPMAGLVVGATAPILSHVLTGMPPMTPPIAPLMVVELLTYGWAAGALSQRSVACERRRYFAVYLWLIPALVCGRLALLATTWLVGSTLDLGIPPGEYVMAAIRAGVPGIGLQLVLIPMLFRVVRGKGASQ